MPQISTGWWILLGVLVVLILASIYSYRKQKAAIAAASQAQNTVNAQTSAITQNVWDAINQLLQTKMQNNTITTTTTTRPA